MPIIHIGPETDDKARRCWGYDVRVTDDADVARDHRVTLSWSDYDLWSRGRLAPEKVVHAVFRFLLQREGPQSILPKFDCGVVRRYFPEVDRELPGML